MKLSEAITEYGDIEIEEAMAEIKTWEEGEGNRWVLVGGKWVVVPEREAL